MTSQNQSGPSPVLSLHSSISATSTKGFPSSLLKILTNDKHVVGFWQYCHSKRISLNAYLKSIGKLSAGPCSKSSLNLQSNEMTLDFLPFLSCRTTLTLASVPLPNLSPVLTTSCLVFVEKEFALLQFPICSIFGKYRILQVAASPTCHLK